MTITVRDSGSAARQIAKVVVRDSAGAAHDCAFVRSRDGAGASQLVWSAFSASLGNGGAGGATVDQSSVSGTGYSSGAVAITTNAATVTASGAPPVTYSWTRIDTNPGAWTILAPTAASTAFRASAVPAGTLREASFQCIVTDAGGSTATLLVSAQATNNYGGLS